MSNSQHDNSNSADGGPSDDALRASKQIVNRSRNHRRTTLTPKAELELSETKFKSVMMFISDGVITFDETGHIETFNNSAEKIFGYLADEVIGRSFALLVPVQQSDEQRKDAAKNGPIGICKNRDEIRLKLNLSKIQIGTQTTFVAIVRPAGELDVLKSELKDAQDGATGAFVHSSELLDKANERLQNRITEIMTESDRLDGTNADEAGKKSLGLIRRNGAYLMSFFEHLLNYVELAAGSKSARITKVHTSEILDEVWESVHNKAIEKNVGFTIDCQGAFPDRIRTDAELVKTILIELAGNGIKFTESGEVRLTVRYVENSDDEDGPGLMEFEVADNGAGVPEEVVETLFKPFASNDSAGQSNDPCAGLGLALTQYRAKLIGSEIIYEKGDESGSIFKLSLDCGSMKNVPMMRRDLKSVQPEGAEEKAEEPEPVAAAAE